MQTIATYHGRLIGIVTQIDGDKIIVDRKWLYNCSDKDKTSKNVAQIGCVVTQVSDDTYSKMVTDGQKKWDDFHKTI